VYDVIIIGSGPAGLACAIEATQNDLNYVVLEKGCLLNAIYHFPTNLTFFSTPDLLEIGHVPLIIQTEKPTRVDLLNYYRRVAEHFNLRINLYENVLNVVKRDAEIVVETERQTYVTTNVIVATGQFDNPNLLNVPGEDLPKVQHYYKEAHPYYRKKVAVIGGKNSAVESSLELFRWGAEVTLIHRGDSFGKSVKYWILPDIENRIKEGNIKAYFNAVVREIKEDTIIIEQKGKGTLELQNDFVLAMTGYHPDRGFLRNIGIDFRQGYQPVHDPETLESNVPGVYIAGVLTAGSDGSKVFIENSRDHGKKIIGNIVHGRKKTVV